MRCPARNAAGCICPRTRRRKRVLGQVCLWVGVATAHPSVGRCTEPSAVASACPKGTRRTPRVGGADWACCCATLCGSIPTLEDLSCRLIAFEYFFGSFGGASRRGSGCCSGKCGSRFPPGRSVLGLHGGAIRNLLRFGDGMPGTVSVVRLRSVGHRCRFPEATCRLSKSNWRC